MARQVPVPPREDQTRIVSALKALDTSVDTAVRTHEKAKLIFDGLVAVLIDGHPTTGSLADEGAA
jgi:hypothetical protein